MKYLLIAFVFIAQAAEAIEIAKIHSEPGVSSKIQYEISGKEIKLQKESNYFDEKVDLTLGTFTLKNTDKISLKRINVIWDEIQRTDALLKKKGSSFNEFSTTKAHHKPYITIGEFKILEGSNYYGELEKLLTELSSLPREHISGISLSGDFKTVTHIKNQKKTSTTPFDIRFSCKKPAVPTVCYLKGEGFLILKK